jgi:acetylornithine deacetylase/succinyl-diaminopimelate desuccinylase-like protein
VEAFLLALGLDEVVDALGSGDEAAAFARIEAAVEDPILRRSLAAMLRDTVTTNMIQVGKKMNVIPGSGEAQIDVRTLPGTDQRALLDEMQATVGSLAAKVGHHLPALEAPATPPSWAHAKRAGGATPKRRPRR